MAEGYLVLTFCFYVVSKGEWDNFGSLSRDRILFFTVNLYKRKLINLTFDYMWCGACFVLKSFIFHRRGLAGCGVRKKIGACFS